MLITYEMVRCGEILSNAVKISCIDKTLATLIKGDIPPRNFTLRLNYSFPYWLHSSHM